MTVVPTWKLGLTADKQTRLLNMLWIRAQALACGSGVYFMLAMWPCISYFISMCLNFLICKMGCYVKVKLVHDLVKTKRKLFETTAVT